MIARFHMSRIQNETVDISMTREGMMTFPVAWHPFVEVTQLKICRGRETRKITLGTHTGTHVDAPRHFVAGGKTIEHVDLNKFFGKAILPISQICQTGRKFHQI